ncbi:hypothetical protein FHX81_8008 [Saccharothrix saharensis]|uniref:Uncharacterized protein n=1 Tax=Saccharothrix saharensis TaxID=571190 RepID=A0A543JRV4_9PSEU|nr:hypothetical protein [Saccharothrix saharensis]TQM85517.1 hypothetical protein FHX81_8008 [Saccharothrix saharensis]
MCSRPGSPPHCFRPARPPPPPNLQPSRGSTRPAAAVPVEPGGHRLVHRRPRPRGEGPGTVPAREHAGRHAVPGRGAAGSRGATSKIALTGDIRPDDTVPTLPPFPEANDATGLAGDTGIPATRRALRTSGVIGDGPHGSTGDGTGDFDYYSFDLRAGDVLGASLAGGGTRLAVHDPAGREVFGSSQDLTSLFAVDSPMPGGGNAVIDFDEISAPAGPAWSPNTYLGPRGDRIAFLGRAIGNMTSHEAGHMSGSRHTGVRNDVHGVMDTGGDPTVMFAVGPDGVGGTADDPDLDIVTDALSPGEGFTGVEDTAVRTAWAFVRAAG